MTSQVKICPSFPKQMRVVLSATEAILATVRMPSTFHRNYLV